MVFLIFCLILRHLLIAPTATQETVLLSVEVAVAVTAAAAVVVDPFNRNCFVIYSFDLLFYCSCSLYLS